MFQMPKRTNKSNCIFSLTWDYFKINLSPFLNGLIPNFSLSTTNPTGATKVRTRILKRGQRGFLLCANYCAMNFKHVVLFNPYTRTTGEFVHGWKHLHRANQKPHYCSGLVPVPMAPQLMSVPSLHANSRRDKSSGPAAGISGYNSNKSCGDLPWWWHPQPGTTEKVPLGLW
jgi:hypothetical protein